MVILMLHTSFGETDVTTGIWKPKSAPSVTYGTNGFFLKFDNSANMGLDSQVMKTIGQPMVQLFKIKTRLQIFLLH